MYFGGYGAYHGSSFEQTYRCYPASFIDKPQLENGDKIIMPPSALDRLASLHIDYPMLFELHNAAAERVSHCGVLEFIAEEGMIYMPYWMMENLLLQEGDIVRVKNATLPKGTYVKLQPHTKDFLDISNPKAIIVVKGEPGGRPRRPRREARAGPPWNPRSVRYPAGEDRRRLFQKGEGERRPHEATPLQNSLETTLRNFSCLTTGDSIMVAYNNKKYYIDIVETKPSNAVSIIETDCEVDFAPPLDYKEPERPVASVPSGKIHAEGQEAPAEPEPKFNPFTGSARRLDGKSLTYQPPAVSVSSGPKVKQSELSNGTGQSSAGSSSQSTSRQSQGKLVFGSSASRSADTPKQKEARKEGKQEQPEKKEESKFQPFTGKKYSLKG